MARQREAEKKTKYGKPVQKTEEASCPRLVTLEDMMACKTANSIWCSDITETKINGRKMYTCAVLDVGTRRVVGSESDTHMRESLVHRALKMAIGRNPVRAENIVLHTDGGKQFVSKETTRIVKEAGFQKSVSRPGTPCDNLLVETLWKTMKREMPSVRHLNFEMAKMEVVKYIEMYYNTDRQHFGFGLSITE